ncbi:mucin-4-like [Microtus oregoni]|uniref:mucin-4-like n=1 Tax=Microtus oregoni TaxID=111838 RepID=UPI001BB25E0C|nr:mucin-4-like [Microtus oregoni]
MDTSSSPQTTLTAVTTSTFPPFTSGSPPAQRTSQGTSSPEETANVFISGFTNTKPTISEVQTIPLSTDSTPGNTGITSPTVSESTIPVNTEVSMTNSPNVLSTVTTPITSTRELPTSSQSLHTETMETSSTPQTTHTEVTTSSFSPSPSGSPPAQTLSHGTSSPAETTDLLTTTILNTNSTMSEEPTTAFSIEFSSGNTGITSPTVSPSSTPVNTDVSKTSSTNVLSMVTTPITATEASQNLHTGSMETSSTPQTTLTAVTTSTFSPFTSGSPPAQTTSQGTSSPEETTNYFWLKDKFSKFPIKCDISHHFYSGIASIFSEPPHWKHGH